MDKIINELEDMILECNKDIKKYRQIIKDIKFMKKNVLISENNLIKIKEISLKEINLLTIRKETIKEIIVKIRILYNKD